MNKELLIIMLFACAVSSYVINAINLVFKDDMFFMLRFVGVLLAPLGMLLGVML